MLKVCRTPGSTCYIDDVLQDKCSKNVPQLSIKSDNVHQFQSRQQSTKLGSFQCQLSSNLIKVVMYPFEHNTIVSICQRSNSASLQASSIVLFLCLNGQLTSAKPKAALSSREIIPSGNVPRMKKCLKIYHNHEKPLVSLVNNCKWHHFHDHTPTGLQQYEESHNH